MTSSKNTKMERPQIVTKVKIKTARISRTVAGVKLRCSTVTISGIPVDQPVSTKNRYSYVTINIIQQNFLNGFVLRFN
jgi:hypothetical protein